MKIKILLVVTLEAVHLKMVETLLMKTMRTTMAHCASHVIQNYSFVYGLNCCQNMILKNFLKPGV